MCNHIKEAIAIADVKDYSEYKDAPSRFLSYWRNDPNDLPDQFDWEAEPWDRYKADYESDVLLCIQTNTQMGLARIETSLLSIAVHLIIGAEKILDAPNGAKAFQIDNAKDRDDAIDFNVRQTLVNYINHLPLMLTRAFAGAFEDSIQRHVTLSVTPSMRDHWKDIGMPENFDVLAAWERPNYVEATEEYRKFWTGKNKPVIPESLPEMYDELRLEYVKARKYHKNSRDLFLRSNNEEAWRKSWEEHSSQMFPGLAYACLMMLCDEGHQSNSVTPAQLAHKHLSYWYNRSPEYMKKQVSDFRLSPEIKLDALSQKTEMF